MLLYSMQHGQDSNNFQTVWLRIDPVSRHRDLILPPSSQKPKSKPRRRAIPLISWRRGFWRVVWQRPSHVRRGRLVRTALDKQIAWLQATPN